MSELEDDTHFSDLTGVAGPAAQSQRKPNSLPFIPNEDVWVSPWIRAT